MCTLILGRDVLGQNSVFLGANRDEDPHRASDPPRVLVDRPRVVGGRDRVAGGTWLAIREGRAAVAILNRRDSAGAPAPAGERRSRGLLALDVAVAEDPKRRLDAALEGSSYAPFSLVYAAPDDCWLLTQADGMPPRYETITAGWHVLTHQDLDDPSEPRTAWLLGVLSESRLDSLVDAERRITELLRSHGESGTPPVCLHRGRMVTVSSSLVRLGAEGSRYVHAEGPPCENSYTDHSALLYQPATETP